MSKGNQKQSVQVRTKTDEGERSSPIENNGTFSIKKIELIWFQSKMNIYKLKLIVMLQKQTHKDYSSISNKIQEERKWKT